MVEEPGSGTAINQCLLEGFFHQSGFQRMAGGPADDFSTVKVHDGGQIKPALRGMHVSDVADPDVIGRLGFWLVAKQITGDGMRVIGVGGFGFERPFLTGFEVQGAHVPGHPVTATANAQPLQTNRQARAAIHLAMGDKEAGESLAQLLVSQCPPAGAAAQPGIVGTARHAQHLADILDGVLLGHKLDQGIPLGGTSDSMPMAFFRISWCSLSFWFSLRSRRTSSCICSGERVVVSRGW